MVEDIIRGEEQFANLSGTNEYLKGFRNLILDYSYNHGTCKYYMFDLVLGHLGVSRLGQVLDLPVLEFVDMQKKTANCIAKINDRDFRLKLRSELYDHRNSFALFLQRLFDASYPYPDIRFDLLKSHKRIILRLGRILTEAEYFVNFQQVLAELSGVQKIVIDYLYHILKDPNIYDRDSNTHYKTYERYEFNLLFARFNRHQLSEIIKFFGKIRTIIRSLPGLINDVVDKRLR
ncbi:BTA121 domain-containing protein surface lipoprotein [Borrelia coriaceae]|nr:hypothetical protein [Borrelia coriaceae]